MGNSEIIQDFLRTMENNQYCDDCLSSILKIFPRQQVNQLCRNLFESNRIKRNRGLCYNCSKEKIGNSHKIYANSCYETNPAHR